MKHGQWGEGRIGDAIELLAATDTWHAGRLVILQEWRACPQDWPTVHDDVSAALARVAWESIVELATRDTEPKTPNDECSSPPRHEETLNDEPKMPKNEPRTLEMLARRSPDGTMSRSTSATSRRSPAAQSAPASDRAWVAAVLQGSTRPVLRRR